jgi:hypothetical protein
MVNDSPLALQGAFQADREADATSHLAFESGRHTLWRKDSSTRISR